VAGDAARSLEMTRSGHSALHSITSSAIESIVGGTSMPSTHADCRLMMKSNLVDCSTGKSTGLALLTMLPV